MANDRAPSKLAAALRWPLRALRWSWRQLRATPDRAGMMPGPWGPEPDDRAPARAAPDPAPRP